jgi:hypothetical protein
VIGWLVPIVGALAYWIASEQAGGQSAPAPLVLPPAESPKPRQWRIGMADPMPWHLAAALVTPLAYSYGELREMVAILDHRNEHDAADRLALVVLSLVPIMKARSGYGDAGANAWFQAGAGRFRVGIPPYPPPPPTPW